MKVYVNERSEIKDVDTTTDSNLREVYIDDESNPFKGWTKIKITCYKVEVNPEGIVVMMTPYVDTRIIDHLDKLSQYSSTKMSEIAYIGDTQVIFPQSTDVVASATVIDADGNLIPCTVTILDKKTYVTFEPLKSISTVTITV